MWKEDTIKKEEYLQGFKGRGRVIQRIEQLQEMDSGVYGVGQQVVEEAQRAFAQEDLRGCEEIYGGSARKTGLVFVGNKLIVTIRKGQLFVYKSREVPTGGFRDVPFVRGPLRFVEAMIKTFSKWFLIAWVSITLGLWVALSLNGIDPRQPIAVIPEGFKAGTLDVLMTLGVVTVVGVILGRWLGEVFRWHGAEHKTILWWNDWVKSGVKPVEEYGRFTSRCGSALVTYLFMIQPVLRVWIGSGWVLWLSLSLGYEVFKLMNPDEPTRLSRVLFVPAWLLQHVVCWEPRKEQLQEAVKAAVVLGYCEKSMMTKGPAKEDQYVFGC